VKMRVQADADPNEDTVTGVLRRESRVDFQTSTSAGLRLLSDLDVLTLAAHEGRVLVSHDRRAMPQAFARFVSSNVSPGLFIVSQKANLLTAIDERVPVWSPSRAEEWTNPLGAIPFRSS
jgi:hypothetical protein